MIFNAASLVGGYESLSVVGLGKGLLVSLIVVIGGGNIVGAAGLVSGHGFSSVKT